MSAITFSTSQQAWGWLVAHNGHWLIRHLPNALTLVRILAVPTSIMAYLSYSQGNHREAAGWLIATAGLFVTDFVDGRLARKLKVVSRFGAVADPLMDKLAIVTLMAAYLLALNHSPAKSFLFPTSLPVTVRIITDAALASLALYALVRKLEIKGANKWGKRKFFVDCVAVTIGWGMLLTLSRHQLGYSPTLLGIGLTLSAVFGILSLDEHISDYHRNHPS